MIGRYGGQKFWENVADVFHDRLRTDSNLRGFFHKRSDSEALMINFNIFRAGFGEELAYYAQAVQEVHRDKGITSEHINRFLSILRAVLIDESVEDEDIQLIVSRISVYGTLITQVNEEKSV